MSGHIHIGLMFAIAAFLSVKLLTPFWNLILAANRNNALGQAMAFFS